MTRPRDAGAVLLNALVLVMAITSVSAGLLTLAVQGTAHQAALRADTQARLYLKAGEALVTEVLQKDWRDAPGTDHPGEIWAIQGYSVPIDRGTLSGQLSDLQGRFNLNWLSARNPLRYGRAFDRLIGGLGLPPALGTAIRGHLRRGGVPNPAPYFNRPLPIRPQGGRIGSVAALRTVPGMTDAAFDRLAPFVAALPQRSRLNVNTAPAPVLAALFPAAGPRGIARLQARAPFDSVAEFASALEAVSQPGAPDDLAADRLSVTTEWFSARLEVRLDGTTRRQQVHLYRAVASGAVSPRQRVMLP